MKYEIKGGNFPVVICNLEEGETMNTDGGGMVWMSPNMSMQTEGGGGIGKAFGRALAGEKMFRNNYTAVGGPGMIAFGAACPGTILAIEITPDKPIIIQKGAYLAGTPGIQTEVAFKKKLSSGIFGGEGFIMTRVFGEGIVFLEIDGAVETYDLAAGEQIVVDTGNLAMYESGCSMDIVAVKGAKNVLFGGEGLFNTIVTGPGKVTLQTLTISEFAARLAPYMPTSSDH